MAVVIANPLEVNQRNAAAKASGKPDPSSTTANSALVASVVKDLLGFEATAAQDNANSLAQTVTAQGYDAEIKAYTSGEAIARQNATLEGISGEIQSVQQMRELGKAVGATRASLAAAGFKESGTAVDQIADEVRQGYLSDQLIRTQSSLQAGGYLEQAASDVTQAQGAQMAKQSAQTTATAYTAAATTAQTDLANETAALTTYLKSTNANTPETKLATGVLGNDSSAVSGALQSSASAANIGTTSMSAPRAGGPYSVADMVAAGMVGR